MNLLEQYTATLRTLFLMEQTAMPHYIPYRPLLLRRLDILWVRLMEPEQHTVCNIPGES